jgi:hypothetical protein
MALARAQYTANRLDSRTMSRGTGYAITFCPAIITIHDNRYMAGDYRSSALTGGRRVISTRHWRALYFHQVGFFLSQQFFNFCNETIGQLLHIVMPAAFLVFTNFFLLHQILEHSHGIAPGIAH